MKRQVLKFSQFLRESEGLDEILGDSASINDDESIDCILTGDMSGCLMLSGQESRDQISRITDRLDSISQRNNCLRETINYLNWVILQFQNGVSPELIRSIGGTGNFSKNVGIAMSLSETLPYKMKMGKSIDPREQKIIDSGLLDRIKTAAAEVKKAAQISRLEA